MKATITAVLMITLLAAPAALAGTESLLDLSSVKDCRFEPTPYGWEIGSQGIGRLSKTPNGEFIDIKVKADLDDGTLLVVSLTMADGRAFDIGTIGLLFKTGLFHMDGNRMFQVDDVTHIGIRKGDKLMLKGTCGGVGIETKP